MSYCTTEGKESQASYGLTFGSFLREYAFPEGFILALGIDTLREIRRMIFA